MFFAEVFGFYVIFRWISFPSIWYVFVFFSVGWSVNVVFCMLCIGFRSGVYGSSSFGRFAYPIGCLRDIFASFFAFHIAEFALVISGVASSDSISLGLGLGNSWVCMLCSLYIFVHMWSVMKGVIGASSFSIILRH